MTLPRTIRNFNAFIDGFSYFGLATEAKLPQPTIMTEAHRGAGMDGSVGLDMGTEALAAEVTLSEHRAELITALGSQRRLVLRPAQAAASDIGDADTIIATVGGLVTATESGDLKPGANSTLKLVWDVRYYRLEMNGRELIEIDKVAGIRRIGAIDQLAAIRRAMGV
jgi:P2 family phage contractile tail tube protein